MPNEQFFGGAPNAFAGGMEWNTYRREQRKKENALNALIERFGPEAATPQALATLNAQAWNKKIQPYALNAYRRTDTAQEAIADRYGPIAASPVAQQSQVQAQGDLRNTSLGVINALKMARSNGADMGVAFDQVLRRISDMGYPVEQIASMREEVIQNPGSLEEWEAALQGIQQGAVGSVRAVGAPVPVYNKETGERELLQYKTDGTYSIIPGYTSASAEHAAGRLEDTDERIGQGWQRLTLDEAKMYMPSPQPGVEYFRDPATNQIVAGIVPGSPQGNVVEEKKAEHVEAAKGMVEIATNTIGFIDEAITALKDVPQGSGNIGAMQRWVGMIAPGSDTRQFYRAALKPVLSEATLGRLSELKATGATLGQISKPELEMLRDSRGALDNLDRDPALILADLERIRGIFKTKMDESNQFIASIPTTYPTMPGPEGSQTSQRLQSTQGGGQDAAAHMGSAREALSGFGAGASSATGNAAGVQEALQARALQLKAENPGLSPEGVIDMLIAEGWVIR